MTARWLAIANPRAGAFRYGDFRGRWMPRVEAAVERVVYTLRPGHAAEIAREAAGYDGLAVVGGDGTLFETIAGSAGTGRLHALVPAGRGNCLALDLGVGSVPEALAALAGGEALDVDLMEVELESADGSRRTCRAASTLAAGYVAQVVARAARLLPLGRQAYAASAVLTLPRRFALSVRYGDGRAAVRRLASVIVNNTRHLANFRAFRRADLTDGLLDVLELDAGWARQMLHNASVLSGRYFYRPGHEIQAPSVDLRFDSPERLMVDGEIFEGVTACRVRSVPAAARFLRRRAT